MVKLRVPMKYGTRGKKETKNYDLFMIKLREKGWLNPQKYIDFGISGGVVLQIGHGPGYTGLEWLKHAEEAKLKALEVSSEMIEIAKKNIKEYPGLERRIEYVNCSAEKMDIEDESIDGVFCNGEVHEWPNPIVVFNEINRVIKPGGKYYISTHRRDLSSFSFLLQRILMPGLSKDIWEEHRVVINAAYTYEELKEILKKTDLKNWQLIKGRAGMRILGEK